ncbi:hypothetical protein E4198_10455 [Streptomyces sp. RKND-216]|uniref:polymorphic toxin-type HINT domain-containing protein n=1 Tax=Streptomyces sp. RKND-216 TaxID=2562581 RepID=UPI00109DA1DE|nr:polymorphic toxin-type HINT domain-containing protein [Streptomyces sp. RKND-216]THA25095.1 hypothetical protein E4198_10455 [Streptomyces sp. RKND-216]
MARPAWLRSRTIRNTHRFRRHTIVGLGLALSVGLLPGFVPQAAASGPPKPEIQDLDDPVPGKPARNQPHPANPVLKAKVKAPPRVVWPEAGTETLRPVSKSDKGKGGPLRLAGPSQASRSGAASPAAVDVTVLSRKKTLKAGVDGVLLDVRRSDGAKRAAPVDISLDYSGFAEAYGGDYGARLRLVQYPACLVDSPQKPECREAEELGSVNDTAQQRLTARVEAAGDGSDGAAPLVAALAGEGSDQGSYGATPLQPSAQWSVSNSSGAFNWSYPLRTPPVPGGLSPAIGLGYGSQSIDGQTAVTNNQGSWVGLGFSYEPGFIERRYKGCAKDGHKETNGDLCWAYDNATVQIAGGTAGRLVKDDDTGQWRVSADDNTRVEKKTGAPNGDDNGEYWVLTSADGTEYYFGLDNLPGWSSGDEQTESTWTVPVYGDDTGEPCYDATLADAHCRQAWRWNLDYVKDTHGNVMSFFYDKETNHYTQGLRTEEDGKPYTRGGYLARIEYGQRHNEVYEQPAAARVVLDVTERCIGESSECEPGDLTDATASRWPDVPWDRHCKAATKCEGQNSPTFWTRKKLSKITTQIRSGSDYSDVESWKLRHIFTDNGDSSKSLWLKNIDHTGHVGGTATMPSVELLGEQLPNRVDVPGDDIQAMHRHRLSGVDNDTGGLLDIVYEAADCASDDLPAPDSSTERCFPVKWNPPGAEDPITDWFHKYVVRKTVEDDLSGGAPSMVTEYDYVGGAGWKEPKPDGISDAAYRTKSDWRGYAKVRVTKSDGTAAPENTRTEHTFLRGMGGEVTDSEGAKHQDSDHLSGHELETATYNGGFAANALVRKSINTVWTHRTAQRAESWGTQKAWYTAPQTTTTFTPLEGGGRRVTKATTRYDDKTGRPVQTDDYGQTGDASDNTCTKTSYADNPDAHILSMVSRVEKLAVSCGDPYNHETQVLADTLTHYDGKAHGEGPTKGDTTKVRRLAFYEGSTPTYQTVTSAAPADFDRFGRPLKVTDAAGESTSIAYTDSDGLATKKTETNPLGWVTSTEYEPAWGQPAAQVDPNGYRTELGHDPLGRLTGVWLEGRGKDTHSPSIRYTYLIRKGEPTAVKTEKLGKDLNTYSTEYTLYDGLLRPRQVQTEGEDGDRLVADTYYNGLGEIRRTHATYAATGAPQDQLFLPEVDSVDSATVTAYDGAGRKTADILEVEGSEKWRTTYAYGGDRTHVDPPVGTAPVTTITDAQGRTTEIRRYKGEEPQPSGTSADYEAMRYDYDAAGRLTEVTDQAANSWTYGYDQRGRKIWSDDPDAGRTTYAYDSMDRAVATTDARGVKVSTEYDEIGRTLGTWEGEPGTGERLTLNLYDGLKKNTLFGAYRYQDGEVLTSTLTTRVDDFYRPVEKRYSVGPAAPHALQGAYEFTTLYNKDGTIAGTTLPKAAGLPSESLLYEYDELQRPTVLRTTSTGSYVGAARYSPTSLLQSLELTRGGDSKRTTLSYTYERGTDRLTGSQVYVSGTDVPYDAHYSYDQSGNVQSITDTPNGGSADVQCFTHDWQSRLTEAWTSSKPSDGALGTGAPDAACSAGPSSSAIGGPAPYWQSFAYDASGNRSEQVRHGVGSAPDVTRTYTYGEGDAGPHQLTKVVQQTPAHGGDPAVTSQDTFTYDAAGNTEQRVLSGNTQTLEWNAEGRLAASTDAAGQKSTFGYDAGGSRLLRDEPDATTLYLPGMELRLDKSTGEIEGTRYYSFAGQTVALRTSEGVTFLAGDRHGTAQVAVDPQSGEVTRRRMDPFGMQRGTPEKDWVDDKGFLGKPMDSSTGLTHVGAREYEPENGRFVSADPVIDFTDPQQINGYAYANNSPVTSSDPSGLMLHDSVTGLGFGNQQVLHNYIHNHIGVERYRWMAQRNTVAANQAAAASAEANAAKQQAIAAAKELAAVVADELGITAALDCFTTGSLGSCGETAVNIATSFAGGVVGKLAAKYGLPWKWKKAVALGKRIAGLVGKLVSGFKTYWKQSKAAAKWSKIAAKVAKKQGDDAMPAACPVSNSFTPDTRVLMADGSTKPISEVRIGDEVRATDPETGETTVETVTAEILGKGLKRLVRVTVDVDGDKGDETASVTATDGHPFWVPELDAWIDATDLKAGQWLRTSVGTHVQITAVARYTQPTTVHNLTVTDTHTYYVLAGATPVLVHNCDGDVHWANENANMSSTARAYDAGAAGSRAGVAPALQYYKAGGKSLSQIKFDGFDAANGVMIDRKVSVTTFNKTYRQAMNQSLALEQNGYSGRWEVPTAAEAARARKVLGGLLITNIRVRVAP